MLLTGIDGAAGKDCSGDHFVLGVLFRFVYVLDFDQVCVVTEVTEYFDRLKKQSCHHDLCLDWFTFCRRKKASKQHVFSPTSARIFKRRSYISFIFGMNERK